MAQFSKSPQHDILGLAAEADEISTNPFFEAELDSPLEAIEHYCRSHLAFQRLAYTQGIGAAALTAGYQDCVEVLLPLVEHLARDSEPEIRGVAVQQICGLGAALHKKDPERSLQEIESTLLVCAQQCALDDEDEVSQAAILAFQRLVQLLPAARATAASKRAVDRLEVRGTDDGTLAAVRLLAHTVRLWTEAALQRHVPRYINRWANHRDFSVREAVATCMSLVVKPIPLALCHQLLLPLFYQLCRDSNWRVRRACSMDLPRLAQALCDHHEQKQQQQQQQQQGKQQGQQQSSSSSRSQGPPDGSCSEKTSTCLHTIRMSTDSGSLSTGNLQAMSHHGGLHSRNRSSSAVNVPLRSATTAEIMTKHPMHSSLITDSLLYGSSLAAPASGLTVPVSSSQPQQQSTHCRSVTGQEEEEQQQQQQQQGQRQRQPTGSPAPQQAAASSDDEDQPSSCTLQHCTPLVHDCWCALRQCMELLTADSSHWVKVAALSGLGPFLLLLPGCQVGQLLLGRFTGMAGSTVVIYEISVALSCAQQFGPLAVRLGPERWPDMRDAWHALQLSRDPTVLCEVVKCLPSLVAALGPAISVHELLPALAGLLQAHLSWIAGQVVPVMADLLELLPPSSQDMLLKVLHQLVSPSSERSKSWRLRRDLALQLGRMAAAVGPEAITDSLWPAVIALCCDPVASVRSAAASQVGAMLAALPASLLVRREHGDEEEQDGGNAELTCSSTSSSSTHSSRRSSDSGSSCNGVESSDPTRDAARCNGCASSCSSKACSPTKQDFSSEDDTAGTDVGESNGHHHSGSSSVVRFSTERAGASPERRSPGPAVAAGADQLVTYGVRFQAFSSAGGLGSYAAAAGSRSSSGRSSFEMELDLPSALAPAPVAAAQAAAQPATAAVSAVPVPPSYSAHPALGRVISSSLGSLGNGSSSLLAGGGSSGSSSESDSSSLGGDSDDEEPATGSSMAQHQQPPPPQQQQEGASNPQHQEQQPEEQQHTSEQDQQCAETGFTLASFFVTPQRQQEEQASQPQPVQQQRYLASTVHPAMMPIGHPAMLPVGTKQQQQHHHATPRPSGLPAVPRAALPAQQAKALKAKSAGDLLKVEAAAQRIKRHHSSNSMPGRTLPAPGVVSSSNSSSCFDTDFDPRLPDPSTAAPHQYVSCLLNFFGCSPQHQQRQLFVPLVMGMLAACHDRLSCEQAAQLLDRLEVLATDAVPGVRYAVAAALQDVKLQAAQLQQQSGAGKELSSQQEAAAAAPTLSIVTVQADGSQQSLDSYQSYVKQLAARSCTPRAVQQQQQQVWEAQAGGAGVDGSTLTASGGQQGAAGAADAVDEQGCKASTCTCGVAVGDAAPGLEWLVKLSSCQQLERLMGVVALTTGA